MARNSVLRLGGLAVLALMSVDAHAAALVQLFDDGPNGPLGSCILQPGLWDVTFERDYASLASLPQAVTASTSVMDGDVTLVIKCDGTAKVSFPSSTVEYSTTTDAMVDGKPIDHKESDNFIPITFGAVIVSKSPADANPVISITVDLPGADGHQVWQWHVVKNEAPDRKYWLSGDEPWDNKSPAAANPNGPAVNPGNSVGNYQRLDRQSIYVAAHGHPWDAVQPGGEYLTDGGLDGFTMTPISAAPTVTFTDDPIQDYLAHIGPVMKTYKAHVEWGKLKPGAVSFSIGGATVPATGGPADYEVPIDVSDRDAGAYVVTAKATTPAGLETEASVPLHVIAVPAWGKDFNFAVAGMEDCHPGDCVRYTGSSSYAWPDLGNKLPNFTIPKSIPIIGGKWGLEPITFALNSRPRSVASAEGSNLNDGKVTGQGGVWIAGGKVGLEVKPVDASAIRAQVLDEPANANALKLVQGEIGDDVAAASGAVLIDPAHHEIDGQIDIGNLIPGLKTVVLHIPVIGGFIVRNLPSVVETSLSVDISGGVAFGAPKDKVEVTSGQVRFEPNGHVGVGINSFLGGAQIQGNLGGHITLGLNPTKIVSCDIHYSFFAIAGSARGYVTVPSNPVAHKFFDCDKGLSAAPVLPPSAHLAATGLPPYAVADNSPDPAVDAIDMTPQVPSRDGWQPPSFVGGPVLVKNATAFIANPAIAARNGVTAIAWIGEDPAKPRPDAFAATLSVERNGKWSAPVVLDNAGPDGHPAVAIDATGNIIAAWDHDTTPTSTTLDGTTLMTAIVDPNSLQVTTLSVDTGAGPAGEPQLASSADGHLLLAWRAGESGNKNAFSLGAALWTGSAWDATQTIAMPSYPDLWRAATDGTGIAIAAAFGETGEIWLSVHDGSGGAASGTIASATPRGLSITYAGGRPVVAWGDGKSIGVYDGAAAIGTFASPGAVLALSADAQSLVYADGAGGHVVARTASGWSAPADLGSPPAASAPPVAAEIAPGKWVWTAAEAARIDGMPSNADILVGGPPG